MPAKGLWFVPRASSYIYNYYYVILSSALRSFKGSPPLMVSDQNVVCISHVTHATCPIHAIVPDLVALLKRPSYWVHYTDLQASSLYLSHRPIYLKHRLHKFSVKMGDRFRTIIGQWSSVVWWPKNSSLSVFRRPSFAQTRARALTRTHTPRHVRRLFVYYRWHYSPTLDDAGHEDIRTRQRGHEGRSSSPRATVLRETRIDWLHSA